MLGVKIVERVLVDVINKDIVGAIEAAGGKIIELTQAEHAAFAAAVGPLRADAGSCYGAGLLDLMGS